MTNCSKIEEEYGNFEKQIAEAQHRLDALIYERNDFLKDINSSIRYGLFGNFSCSKFIILSIKDGIVKYKYYTYFGNEEDGPFYGKIPLRNCGTWKDVDEYIKDRELRKERKLKFINEQRQKTIEYNELEEYNRLKEKFGG